MKPTEVEARLSKHDREIDAIRKVIKTGMRLIVRIEHAQLENGRDIAELRASQKDTDRQIQNLLRAIERGQDGKVKPPPR